MSSRRKRSAGTALQVLARADAPATVTTTQAAPDELLQFDFDAESTASEVGGASTGNTRARHVQTEREASIKDAIIRWLDQQI